MNYILLGAAGFILLHLIDLAFLKRLSLAKPALWLIGTALVIGSSVMVATAGDKLSFPVWISISGWCLLTASTIGMFYSLYLAIPFDSTYVKAGTSGLLVTKGLYRLVRHPWLVFFALSMIGLALGSRSVLAFEAGAAWTFVSAGLVYLQDRHLFPRMFPGYDEYRKTTPMILPNKHSLSAFIEGFKQNKVSEV